MECCLTAAEAKLAGAPTAAVLTIKDHDDEAVSGLFELIPERYHNMLLASTASGVIGGGREHQSRGPAVCMWLAHLPGCAVQGFHLTDPGTIPDFSEELLSYPLTELVVDKDKNPHFLLAAHPFSAPESLLPLLDAAFPAGVKVGGVASGTSPAVGVGGSMHTSGIAGLAVVGDLEV